MPVELRGLAIEVGLLGGEEDPARCFRAVVGKARLARVVVVVQVLIRQRANVLNPLGAEKLALLERFNEVGALENRGENIAAVHEDAVYPTEVVEAQVVDVHRTAGFENATARAGIDLAGIFECRESVAGEAHGRVTNADHAVTENLARDLGNDSRGIREVDEVGAWSLIADCLRDGPRHGNAAKCVAQAAEARRLLAEHAARMRDALVLRAAIGATDANCTKNEIGSAHRIAHIGSDAYARRMGDRGGHSFDDPRHRAQALLVRVPQGEGANPLFGAVLEERANHERDAEASSTEQREFHVRASSWVWCERRREMHSRL